MPMASRLPTKLFVSRLSFYTTNEELKRLFSPFGVVKEAALVYDPRTRRPKGFGFVTYDSEVEAQRALKSMNGRFGKLRVFIGGFPCIVPREDTEMPSILCDFYPMVVKIVNGKLLFVELAKTEKQGEGSSCG